MVITEEVSEWIGSLGIEIILAKNKEDLSLPGLHLVNPSMADLVCACYDALRLDIKVVVVYLRPLVGVV